MTEPATVHASAVLLGERGVLIRGAAGSGKSSLLLGLLTDAAASTWLIADDRVMLTPANGRLIAAVPPVLAGLLEIRGQGIVRRRFVSPAETVSIASTELPLLRLPIGLADGPVRVRAAVAERLLPRR